MKFFKILIPVMLIFYSTGLALTNLEKRSVTGAKKLVSIGRCQKAIDMLLPLKQQYPHDKEIINILTQGYICTGEFDLVLKMLNDQLASSNEPNGKRDYLIDVGSVHLRLDDLEQAQKSFQEAIDLFAMHPQTYQNVSNQFAAQGYYNEAIAVIHQARKTLNQPVLYANQLAYLYEVMRNYGKAADEYFLVLLNDTTKVKHVDNKMINLIGMNADEEFETGLEEALAGIIKNHPENSSGHRYYADYFVQQGRLQEAFHRFIHVDNMEQSEGKNLLRFCNYAADDGNYKLVEDACEYLQTQYQDSRFLTQARFVLGRSLFNSKRYIEAIENYQQILEHGTIEREKQEAKFFIGYTTYYGLEHPEEALHIFEELTNSSPKGRINIRSALYVAECHLALGSIVLADSLYRQVPMQPLLKSEQEELLFRLGEIKFYQGDYEAARQEYGKLMNSSPKSVFVNDALRRIMLITEHTDMEVLTLQILSDALFATFRFEYDSALVNYQKLKDRIGATIADLAYYQSGEIFTRMNKPKLALVEYDSLISKFSESFYAPLALEKKGDIYFQELNDNNKAQEIYEKLLFEYQISLNREEVRRKLNQVKVRLSGENKNKGS